MKIGSLFSGVGGIELGLERAGVGHTVWQCEREPSAQAVLRRHWPGLPIYDDVCKIGASNVEPVDVLCGGSPCQDISLAGFGAGLAGARSGLWFEYLRLIRELRPRYVVVENVAALVTRGLDVMLGGLAKSGYDALWFALRASDVGAPHRRERIFIIAWRLDVGAGNMDDSQGVGLDEARLSIGAGTQYAVAGFSGASLADADSPRREIKRRGIILDGQRATLGNDADGRGGETATMADTESKRQLGGSSGRTKEKEPRLDGDWTGLDGKHDWPPPPNDAEAWAAYLERYPGRAPAVAGKLNPGFVEALMGFPDGWTDGARRNQRLKMLGNAVVPQCAEVVGHVLLGIARGGAAP